MRDLISEIKTIELNLDKVVLDLNDLEEKVESGNEEMVPQKMHLLSSAKEIIDGINYLDPSMSKDESKEADMSLWAEEQIENILRDSDLEYFNV